jgi:hypothetical protein
MNRGWDVHEIRVEDVEFVSLHNLWRWILGTTISTDFNSERVLTRNEFDYTDSTRIQSVHD